MCSCRREDSGWKREGRWLRELWSWQTTTAASQHVTLPYSKTPLWSIGLPPVDAAVEMSGTMSSVQSIASSTTSGEAAATSSDSSSPLLTSQATLYLYTFLVTLVVLFALTGGIIARSCMMRRRFRRRMEEAVRNGTFVPPSSRKPKVGEKPSLHDVWLGNGVGGEGCTSEGSEWWQRLVPVAVMLTGCSHEKETANAPTTRSLASPSSTSVNVIDWFRPNLISTGRDGNRSTPALTDTQTESSHPTQGQPSSAQVVFFIEMPTAHRDTTQGHEGTTLFGTSSESKHRHELPSVDLGVMEAVVKEPLSDS